MLRIIDCEQGSDDWFRCRMGIPTASEFMTVMASGKNGGESKTRKAYMLKLAGEILTGEPMESFSNANTDRGKIMEAEARNFYTLLEDIDLTRVGFVINGTKGCSPDSLIDANGGLEIKTALPHIQIERLIRNELPSEHKAQVQGSLWVCEREYWDFVSYWPKLPMFVIRVRRDEEYIKKIAEAVDQFNDELARVVEHIHSYGDSNAQAA